MYTTVRIDVYIISLIHMHMINGTVATTISYCYSSTNNVEQKEELFDILYEAEEVRKRLPGCMVEVVEVVAAVWTEDK